MLVVTMGAGLPALGDASLIAAGTLAGEGDRVFGTHTFLGAVTMPAFVSGIFRVGFRLFPLGALAAGIGWIAVYVGPAYFLGAEIAQLIADAGTKGVAIIVVFAAAGLGIRAGWSRWRAHRR